MNNELSYSIKGNDPEFPIVPIVGSKLPKYEITIYMEAGGVSGELMKIQGTKRKVDAKETINTPAGTFECYKISHTQTSFSRGEVHRRTKIVVWYAPGIGEVIYQEFDMKGNIQRSITLITVTEP